jgi:hypothetical protein
MKKFDDVQDLCYYQVVAIPLAWVYREAIVWKTKQDW